MGCIEERGRLTGQIAFIDPSLEAWEILATGVRKGIEVIILDPVRDAIEQITTALASRKGVEAVHIICHGSPGTLHLGNTTVDPENLESYAPLLQTWQEQLSEPPNPRGTHPQPLPGGELGRVSGFPLLGGVRGGSVSITNSPRELWRINLYGCQVAAGEIGRVFLEKLHQLTGANIAASSSPVGNPQLGGNWELDVTFGKTAAEKAFSARAMAAYPAILSPSFGHETTFGVGNWPSSIAVEDFNGDGIPDLAVANLNNNNISVLLGDGSDSFGTHTTFGTGNEPLSVAVEDFNGDGTPDLAVANFSGGSVSVLLADGSGNFSAQTTYGTGNRPISIAVGDFNGDSTPDLAVANYWSVSVLLGNSSGSFGTHATFGGGNQPESVAVGDFNGDGTPDLASANRSSNNVSVLLGNGSGGFGPETFFGTGGQPESVAVDDFNGDGAPDLVVANSNSNNVSVLLGDGSGSFGTHTTFGTGNTPISLVVEDFDGDGKSDLVVLNNSTGNGSASVLLGDGSGNFGTHSTFGLGSNPTSIAVQDFNADGKPDLVVANSWDNNVSVFLNTIVVSIAPGSAADEAGPTNGTFDISLNLPAPAGGLVVNFDAIGSTAMDPVDYSLTAGTNITSVTTTTFTIAAGAKSATLNVVPIDDNEVETGGETVNIEIIDIGSSNYIASTTNNTAAVTISDNEAPEIEVSESGTTIVDAGSFDFGSSVVGSNIVKTFTITNSGNADLTLGAESLTGTGYSLVGSFPTNNIFSGGSTTFQIQLDASSTGTFNGNLSFVNSDSDENPYDFSLTGQITAAPEPEIDVNDGASNIADGTTTALDFGSTVVGTAISKIFTIENIGSADLSPSNLSLPTGFSVVGSLPATIAAGSSDSLQIQLDASAIGSFDGTISFDNNDVDENPFDFPVSGTVTATPEPEIEVSDGATNIADGATAPLDFGNTAIGTAITKNFTIENIGSADLSLSNLSLPAGFSVVGNLPASIAPGSSDSLQVQLDASSGGSFNGEISFDNNDADENPFNFAISGTVTVPEIEISDGTTNIADGSTTALSFGSTVLGTAISKTFTIANTGSADLSLSNLSLPAGFSVVGNLPATIAPGSSASLEIQLDASELGGFDGTISFDNNDTDENPFYFPVFGTVTAPEIEVSQGTTNIADGSTTALEFGSTTLGTAISKTLTIENTGGDADLSLSNLSLPGGFSVVGSLPASIAPGSSASLEIQLDASAVGSFDGTISFDTNDADENPFDFAVSGTTTATPEPEIEVSDGSTNIADGTTTALDFGSTAPGTAITKTFTIENIGSADLNLSNLSLPNGFSQVGDLPTSIAPGSSDSLEIQLDGSAVGSFNGTISFDNNDADEGSFDFAIGGTVASNPPIVANSIFSQNVGFHNGNQFSFAADSYVDPDPGDSITYSIALADTLHYSWYDGARGTNGGWYRKAKEGIAFPEVPIPSWLSFDPATRTVTIDEASRPSSFRYGVKITGTDRSGQSVSEFIWFKSYLGGFIIDNYIAGATVFWDANKNGIQDAGELSTTSDQAGEFNLNVDIGVYDTNQNGIIDSSDGQIVATGGIDTATGLPLETPVVATPESTVVTLLTTLVADLVNKGLPVSEANERVATALSLPPGIDINSLDPIAATENNEAGGTETLAAMVQVQNVITQTASLVDGASNADFNAIVQNVVSAITSQIQVGGTLDVTNSATLETIINDAAGATQQNDPNIDLTQVQAIASGAAQVMASSNQQIDTLVASGASGATLTAETANIQKITLGNVTEELEAAASGTKDIALVVAQNTGAALQAKINTPGLTFTAPVSTNTPGIPSLPTLSANIELVRSDATEGTESDDTYIGDSSDNSYLAYSGNDVLFGNSGSDWMNGNRGDDSLDGGEGNDTLYGGKDNDTISGNNGADVIFGNRGSDSLLGNNGSDFLNGNQAEDILFGGNGNDILYGGKQNDTLNGGDGSDTLSGDLGNDILSGGNGSDRFVLKPNYGSDILTDFEDGQDFLALADGLTFEQLDIASENGSTLIRFEEELLATIENVDVSLISSADFVAFG